MKSKKLKLTLRGKVNLVMTIPALLFIPVAIIMDPVVLVDYFIQTAFPYVVLYLVGSWVIDRAMAQHEKLFKEVEEEDA
jgi:hypothetical protein